MDVPFFRALFDSFQDSSFLPNLSSIPYISLTSEDDNPPFSPALGTKRDFALTSLRERGIDWVFDDFNWSVSIWARVVNGEDSNGASPVRFSVGEDEI